MYIKALLVLNVPKGKVLKLNKSLYRLKQSGQEWYIEATKGLKELGFSPCYSEPSIFINLNRSQIISVYVDDILVLGTDLVEVKKTIQGIVDR